MKYVGEKVMNKAAHAGNQHLLLPIPALFHKPYVISRVATDMYPSFIFQQTQKPKSLDRDKGPGQNYYRHNITGSRILFCIFFGVLGCVGHSSAYVAHLWFLRNVWIRTPSACREKAGALATFSHPSLCILVVSDTAKWRGTVKI
jgi:hypothetical protein